jgi:hypothetical protein
MHVNHTGFAASSSLRMSLRRGLARQAMAHAAQDDADVPAIIAAGRALRPNPKSRARLARRLKRMGGIVRVLQGAEGRNLVVILRNCCNVLTRSGTQDLFRESALVYTRLELLPVRGRTRFHLTRASFCLHALERLVERGPVALECPLLPAVDAEAVALLRGLVSGADFVDGDDAYCPARVPGVWAGSHDHAALEGEWGLVRACDRACDDPGVPIFSVRTFLGPGEMRPTVWLRWRDDPALSLG